ncbi:MAG TPA: hypothetical protein VFS40_08280 [Gemmatimonadales bacterium]|nr:hypothetical protein [Gemmatimonadales bacterium]
MHANRMLTGVLRGRRPVTVTTARDAAGHDEAVVTFDDGSRMTVLLADPGAAPVLPADAGAVRKVRQQDLDLALDLERGGTLAFRTAEETSSVLVRAGDGTFEYSD